MSHSRFTPVRHARPGDRIAVLSPAFAAPSISAAVHEQALQRLATITGLVPVEYPTTRGAGDSAQDRARDVNAAFADPSIRAIIATLGGDDQVTVIPFLDADLVTADPKPFIGYSDNTNLHTFLWRCGVRSFYGGSTQVHLGPGPAVDEIHVRSLRAALLHGGAIELTEPGESEDYGVDSSDPRALADFGTREDTEAWTWAGPARVVEGATWGGCIEVIDQVALAGRMPEPDELQGAVLLLETSETLPSADEVRRWARALGERGVLAAVSAVLVARPVVAEMGSPLAPAAERAALRHAQRDVIIEQVAHYNPEAVVCVGVPFGHTRPQWILPHGGIVRVDGVERRVTAFYD